MTLLEAAALAGVGVAAGIVSTVASIASVVSYPALLAFGLPPLSANMTNTVSLLFTAAGAAVGSRPELSGQWRRVWRLSAFTAAGGAAGAVLLLLTPAQAFERTAPVLIGAASLLLLRPPRLAPRSAAIPAPRGETAPGPAGGLAPAKGVGEAPPGGDEGRPGGDDGPPGGEGGGPLGGDDGPPGGEGGGPLGGDEGRPGGDDGPLGGDDGPPGAARGGPSRTRGALADVMRRTAAAPAAARTRERHPALLAGVFCVAVYTGYFGAAGGVLMLAVLMPMLAQPLARTNAVKNVIGGFANGVAAVGFAIFGQVDWVVVGPLAAGFLIGGWTGPALVRRLPATPLRMAIAFAGIAVAVKLGIGAYR